MYTPMSTRRLSSRLCQQYRTNNNTHVFIFVNRSFHAGLREEEIPSIPSIVVNFILLRGTWTWTSCIHTRRHTAVPASEFSLNFVCLLSLWIHCHHRRTLHCWAF